MALPWETLASVSTADGALDLRRRGEKDFLITIGGRILMSSAAHRSEDALAKLACVGLRKKKRARVLVSGLGMGFTLRAALDELADDAEVTVAELNAVVVEWCAWMYCMVCTSVAMTLSQNASFVARLKARKCVSM